MADRNSLFTHAHCSNRKSCNNTLVKVVSFLLSLLLALSGISGTAQTSRPATVPSRDQTTAQSNEQVPTLEPGRPIEREIAGGQTHAYQLPLATGQYARVVVEQRVVDVVVTLISPGGNKVTDVDSPNGTMGREPVGVIAEEAGDYKLEVRTLYRHVPAGRYQIVLHELRPATLEDSRRIAAERVDAEVVMLQDDGTAKSRQRIVDKAEEALSLWRSAGDRRGEAVALNNAARIYGDVSEYHTLLRYSEEALQMARELGDRQIENVALSALGWTYIALGDLKTGLDYHLQALALARQVNEHSFEGGYLYAIGFYYAAAENKQKALQYYRDALPLLRAEVNLRLEADTLGAIGLIYESQGEAHRALDYYDKSLQVLRSINNRLGEASMLGHMGRLYHQSLGEKPRALEYYHQSLSLIRSMENRWGEAELLYRIARVRHDQGDLLETLQYVEGTLQIIESMRAKISRNELRASFFANVQNYYEFYIAVLMRLHKEQPAEGYAGAALNVSERGRARVMLELLAEALERNLYGIDRTLLERARQLRQALNQQVEQQMRLNEGAPTLEETARVEKKIKTLQLEYDQVRARLRESRARDTAAIQPAPLTLREIQSEVVDADTILLEYALGEDKSFLWAVTPYSIASYELPKRAEIEKAARRMYDLLTIRNQRKAGETFGQRSVRVSAADAQYQSAAEHLSEMVLSPVAAQLGTKRLLVVSDGPLQYIPFAALFNPTSTESRGKRQPLVAKHEIVSSPSASVLALQRRELSGRKQAPESLAVFADPVFDETDERVKVISGNVNQPGKVYAKTNAHQAVKTRVVRSPTQLPTDLERSARDFGISFSDSPSKIRRLPFSRTEAQAILEFAPGESFKALDFRASRNVAIGPEMSRYRILHFATHGLLNNEHPELSGIVLSLIDERGHPLDGFLRLNEIYNLELPAELVVLSACQTALGKHVEGEGLVGLVRGFMYAGSKRVVASLWKVDDEATAQLMKIFYRGMLKEGLRPAAALRAAKVEIGKNNRWQLPYYWAAFELQGEWR